jgi:hypothetical protein
MSGLRREDYVLRQVRAVAAMLARIAGLRLDGAIEEARLELERAYSLLLGSRAELIRRMDAKTAATLLGSPETILTLSQLLREEAALESDADRKAEIEAHAAELASQAAT